MVAVIDCQYWVVAGTVRLDRESLAQLMAIVQALGAGDDLDAILEHIARAVVDVIGFDAVAVNVATRTGDLQVRTVVGPPELDDLHGGTLSQEGWLALLDGAERRGELRFSRAPRLDESVPNADPWPERFATPSAEDVGPDVEPWQPEFALLAPMWRGPRELLGVISVDLPRSGYTPGPEQRALLELFAVQAAAAISRVRAVDVANDATNLYRLAFRASPAPTLVLDDALYVTDANGAFSDMADAVAGEVEGRHLLDLLVLPDVDATTTALAALDVTESMVVAEECELRHPRGHAWTRWVHVQARRVDGTATGSNYVCIVTDRTALRRSMSALRRRADYDDLTGLYLRAVGMRHLETRCAAAPDPEPRGRHVVGAVMFCDLDNFKGVNDAGGHRAGDAVLATVAHRLLQVADQYDVVCRWGGDEFVLIVERSTMVEIVELGNRAVAEVQALAAAAAAGEPMSRLNLSVGIAEFLPPVDAAVILEAADAALYRAKSDPRQRVYVEMQ